MQSHRILSALTVFLMVVLLAAGWFLVAQPQLAAASDANTQLAGVQSDIRTAQATIAQLKREQKEIPSLKKTLAGLRLSIPSEVQSSPYITGLNNLAAQSGVVISSITVDDAQLYTPPVAASSSGPASGTSATPSPSPTPTPSGAAAAPKASTSSGWTPPTDSRITSSNFILIPVTVGIKGDWTPTVAFIKGLQSGDRLFLVKALSISHDTTDEALLDTTLTGYIYVIVDPKANALDKAGAGSALPTPTPTPTPTSTVSASPNPSGSSTPTPTTSPTP